MTPLYYHRLYTEGVDPTARFPRERYRGVRSEIAARGGDAWAEVRPSPAIDRADLLRAHDADYVEAFLQGRLDAAAQRRIGLRPWTPEIQARTLHILGGSLAATEAALARGAAGHLAGGTHHAHAAFGSGYCVFNDLAVCARWAQQVASVGRVLIVDLDVHQGDGTAAIFAGDPSVYTVSLHCGRNFPFRKTTSDLDVALDEGLGDAGYLEALDSVWPRVLHEVRPELVLYQAGVDPLAEDHLGRLALTRDGLRARNDRIYAAVRAAQLPLVVTMGGGYARPLEASVVAHADVFEQLAAGF